MNLASNGMKFTNCGEVTMTVHALVQAEPAADAPGEAEQFTAVRGARVLIVDDNAINRLILRKHVERIGGIPALAASGHEALEHLRTAHFDIAILGMRMPEMDGITLAEAIRRQPCLRDLPLVLLSSAEARNADRRLFATLHLKPIKPSGCSRWCPVPPLS
jgi:CheY-like chemotaxis protein